MINKELVEFWENWGFEYKHYELNYEGKPQPKIGWYFNGEYESDKLPELTLDNLFKYIIPLTSRLGYDVAIYLDHDSNMFEAELSKSHYNAGMRILDNTIFKYATNPAIALYEVLNASTLSTS